MMRHIPYAHKYSRLGPRGFSRLREKFLKSGKRHPSSMGPLCNNDINNKIEKEKSMEYLSCAMQTSLQYVAVYGQQFSARQTLT